MSLMLCLLFSLPFLPSFVRILESFSRLEKWGQPASPNHDLLTEQYWSAGYVVAGRAAGYQWLTSYCKKICQNQRCLSSEDCRLLRQNISTEQSQKGFNSDTVIDICCISVQEKRKNFSRGCLAFSFRVRSHTTSSQCL